MPAPSPARGSAPTAPRCSRLQRMLIASETIWCDFRPLMLAMKPTPQESFSRLRSYRPSAGGRQECSRAGSCVEVSSGFEAAVADSVSVTIFSRSNSDPLILVLSIRSRALTVIGAPWAFAARSGHGANRSRMMKFFTGWMVAAAGLALAATAAQAQVPVPDGAGRSSYTPVSDVGGPTPGPYEAMPPEAPRPGYGTGPTLLPSI